jgi:hypothetical protein
VAGRQLERASFWIHDEQVAAVQVDPPLPQQPGDEVRDALGPFVRFVLRIAYVEGKVKNPPNVLEDLVPDAVVVLEVIDPVGDVLRVERVLEVIWPDCDPPLSCSTWT